MSNKVFISFPLSEAETARGIAGEIASRGPEVYVDEVDLAPGADFKAIASDEIDRSKAAIVLINESTSKKSMGEWRAIQAKTWDDPDFKVIPVVVEGATLPPFLRHFQAVRLDNNQSLTELGETLRNALDRTEEQLQINVELDSDIQAEAKVHFQKMQTMTADMVKDEGAE